MGILKRHQRKIDQFRHLQRLGQGAANRKRLNVHLLQPFPESNYGKSAAYKEPIVQRQLSN